MSTREQPSKAPNGTNYIVELIKTLYRTIPADNQKELLQLLSNDYRKENRRKHVRKSSLIPVDYAVQGYAFTDYIRNIGVGGVFIESPVPVSVGQEISVGLLLPNYPTSFKIMGEVVQTNPRGFGIKFKNVPKYQDEMIKSLIEKLDDGSETT